jgi:hypothetical protein
MTFSGFELIGMINLYWHLTPQCPICNRGMCQYYFIAGIGFAFERLGGTRDGPSASLARPRFLRGTGPWRPGLNTYRNRDASKLSRSAFERLATAEVMNRPIARRRSRDGSAAATSTPT